MRVPPMARQNRQQNGAQDVRLGRCVGTLIGHRAVVHPPVPQARRLQKLDEKCHLPERRYRRRLQAASELGKRNTFRGQTYKTFFALLACTGLRVSEAIHLCFHDITADGLVVRCSKFRKSRLVPLHETTHAGLEQYLKRRRAFTPLDDHVFVSLRRRPLLLHDAETAFHDIAEKVGLPRGADLPRPTIHSLRHTFAVRALETCPDGRDRITKHMLALSTYLGHSKVADTYWYLEATPDLMRNIADSCQSFFTGGRP